MAEEFLPPENSGNECGQPIEADKERIKHLLIGKPRVVRRTIQSLHVAGYSEVREWSSFLPAGALGEPGEILSILAKQVLLE